MKKFFIYFVFIVCVVVTIAMCYGIVYKGMKGDTDAAFVCSCGCACYIYAVVVLFDIIKNIKK